MSINVYIDFKVKTKNPYHYLENIIIHLVESGVKRVNEKGIKSNEIDLFSLLVIFSKERIASALANLCNNDVVIINYIENTVYFSPIFERFLKVITDPKLTLTLNTIEEATLITYFPDKRAIMKEIDPHVQYDTVLNYIDLMIDKKDNKVDL